MLRQRGVDHDLIARSNEDLVVEMMGGCLCCTIRGDLLATLRDAPWRFARQGTCWFDRVVIETTGLADPAPILHTLMTDSHLATLYQLDGVITTVDAATGMATLDAQQEAVKQAAMADRILLVMALRRRTGWRARRGGMPSIRPRRSSRSWTARAIPRRCSMPASTIQRSRATMFSAGSRPKPMKPAITLMDMSTAAIIITIMT